ncbi:DUF3563 family protein [Rhizobacter sp. LjRoot28]|jgi:hypothetical protein|uniref:DUF3563 family protein n=1 Tax=Rhizobacter sp. LjRoot28 TaxID=3342309 RepID=UPI003ECE4073
MDALEPLTFPVSGKPRPLLARAWRWLMPHGRVPDSEETAWLAAAADLADLERRLRRLERDGLPTAHRLFP